jgi:hypothetical protein
VATVSGTVTMASHTSMSVAAVVRPKVPTLLDQITALEGQDPLMVGATGYLDDIFTTRLVGDSQ